MNEKFESNIDKERFSISLAVGNAKNLCHQIELYLASPSFNIDGLTPLLEDLSNRVFIATYRAGWLKGKNSG